MIIDDGPLGTTCARVGCMPSKALIAMADDFHKRLFFDEYGISGANELRPDYSRIMGRVRSLRDEFAGGRKGKVCEGFTSGSLTRQFEKVAAKGSYEPSHIFHACYLGITSYSNLVRHYV